MVAFSAGYAMSSLFGAEPEGAMKPLRFSASIIDMGAYLTFENLEADVLPALGMA